CARYDGSYYYTLDYW
nr:immunoglobulin heavy chain junction region [Mus musculus]